MIKCAGKLNCSEGRWTQHHAVATINVLLVFQKQES